VRQQADPVRLSGETPGRVAGTAVRGRHEGRYDAVAVDVRQRLLESGQVVLADFVERDHVGCGGADHCGGFGHRPARVAPGDAAAAQVQLEYP
jgi:hypothetical protein